MAGMLRAPPPPPLTSLPFIDTNGRSSPLTPSGDSDTTSQFNNHHSHHSDALSLSSKHSSVHFDLNSNAPTPQPSKGSLRGQNTANQYQPIHPSTLHTSTVPAPPKTAPALSTHPSYSSGMKPFPPSPSLSMISSPNSFRPDLPRARSSQDRRVWSETLPTSRTHRSGSLIHHGKRASRVTGGFETSSEEEGTTEEFSNSGQPVLSAAPSLVDGFESSTHNAQAGPSRPRAKSLLSTAGRERQGSDASVTSREAKKRREDSGRAKRKESYRQSMPRTVSAKSNSSPPKPSVQLPNSRSDSYFGIQNGSPRSSRPHAARTPLLGDSALGPPSRSPSARVVSLEKVREDATSPSDSKKLKGKEKEATKKSDGLAASLGLGVGGVQDMALSPDQLRSLLSDPDVNSALRMINSPHIPASRPPHLNDWSNSAFFSPPNTRPGTPGPEKPTRTTPYLVSAPPPLTDTELHARDRSMSMASSIAPAVHSTWGSSARPRTDSDTPSQVEPFETARRRASSKAGLSSDGQGGHIPFTHHVPIVTVDENAQEAEDVIFQDNLPPVTENEVASPRSGGPKPIREGKEKKGRLSNLFHLGKRKSGEMNSLDPLLPHKDHKTDQQKVEEKAREKERYEKDMERRRLEQERRDDELSQERRYHALEQISAHPSSERMAYRTGAHLRAFYQHVYEGIDNPPKLNPLAVLRWRIKTEEQNDARTKWEQAQLNVTSGRSERSGPHHASPHSTGRVANRSENIHSSPMSIGSSAKLIESRKSVESARSASLGSLHRSNDVSRKRGRMDDHRRSKNWQFSVEDIVSYKASNGVVNYFIPPRRTHPDIEVLTEDEDECSRAMSPDARPQHDGNSSRKDDLTSLAGSSRKDLHIVRTGVKTASNASLLDAEGVNGDRQSNLSRSASIETGKGGLGKNRLTHRSHQSLSAIGQGAVTHALKQPFEKLSHVAKKQRAPAFIAEDDDRQGTRDEAQPRGGGAGLSQPNNHPYYHGYPHQSAAMVSKASRATMNSVNSRQREQQGFFRRHNPQTGLDGYTDDEGGKEFHLRRLFLKGQRVLASLDDVGKLSRKSEVDLVRLRQDERETELLALEAALRSESTFRQRQAEANRRTEVEIEAQQRIHKLEDEIYAERVAHLETARQKLDPINSYLGYIDGSVRQFLLQVDFIRDEARIAGGIESQWDAIDALRPRYTPSGRLRPGDREDEHRDALPPMRSFDSPYSGSETTRARPNNNAHPSTSSSSRRQRSQSQQQSRPNSPSSALTIPRRRQSLFKTPSTVVDPQLAIPLRHHPRRTYLNPMGTEKVDPIQQAELFIAFGRDRLKDTGKDRQDMKRDLDNMIASIDGMIKQKDAVRLWTREVLERINARQVQLDQLLRQEVSATRFSLVANWDSATNNTIKTIGAIVKIVFWLYYQLRTELSFYLSPFRPSTYCRTKRANRMKRNRNDNGPNFGVRSDHANGHTEVEDLSTAVTRDVVAGQINGTKTSNGWVDGEVNVDGNEHAEEDEDEGSEVGLTRQSGEGYQVERSFPVFGGCLIIAVLGICLFCYGE